MCLCRFAVLLSLSFCFVCVFLFFCPCFSFWMSLLFHVGFPVGCPIGCPFGFLCVFLAIVRGCFLVIVMCVSCVVSFSCSFLVVRCVFLSLPCLFYVSCSFLFSTTKPDDGTIPRASGHIKSYHPSLVGWFDGWMA